MDNSLSQEKKSVIKQLFKYGVVTVISYTILLFGTFLLTDFFSLQENISYLITISFVYVLLYILNVYFVFNTKFNSKNLSRYILVLILFWSFNNSLFNFLTIFFSINYLIAILINIFIFGIVRFFIQKKYVFKF